MSNAPTKRQPKPEHRPERGSFYYQANLGTWAGQLTISLSDGKRVRRTVSGQDEDIVWERFLALQEKYPAGKNHTRGPLPRGRFIRTDSYPQPDPPTPGWDDEANCKGAPLEDFFNTGTIDTQRSIAIHCAPCPVRAECLQEALASRQQIWKFGIWGGTTPTQRRAMLREARDQQTGTRK